jgi:predicted double-glycine peptidase
MSRFLSSGIVAAAVLTMFFSGWMEFLAPALARRELRRLKTRISPSGVCIQGTGYTCGPAAAVTLLRRHGFPADESDLALRGKASEHTGTDGPGLVAAVEDRFESSGVRAKTMCWKTLDELQQAGECLAVIRYDQNIDHWVAVLEVTSESVVLGDPISGKRVMSLPKFTAVWTGEVVCFHFSKKSD